MKTARGLHNQAANKTWKRQGSAAIMIVLGLSLLVSMTGLTLYYISDSKAQANYRYGAAQSLQHLNQNSLQMASELIQSQAINSFILNPAGSQGPGLIWMLASAYDSATTCNYGVPTYSQTVNLANPAVGGSNPFTFWTWSQPTNASNPVLTLNFCNPAAATGWNPLLNSGMGGMGTTGALDLTQITGFSCPSESTTQISFVEALPGPSPNYTQELLQATVRGQGSRALASTGTNAGYTERGMVNTSPGAGTVSGSCTLIVPTIFKTTYPNYYGTIGNLGVEVVDPNGYYSGTPAVGAIEMDIGYLPNPAASSLNKCSQTQGWVDQADWYASQLGAYANGNTPTTVSEPNTQIDAPASVGSSSYSTLSPPALAVAAPAPTHPQIYGYGGDQTGVWGPGFAKSQCTVSGLPNTSPLEIFIAPQCVISCSNSGESLMGGATNCGVLPGGESCETVTATISIPSTGLNGDNVTSVQATETPAPAPPGVSPMVTSFATGSNSIVANTNMIVDNVGNNNFTAGVNNPVAPANYAVFQCTNPDGSCTPQPFYAKPTCGLSHSISHVDGSSCWQVNEMFNISSLPVAANGTGYGVIQASSSAWFSSGPSGFAITTPTPGATATSTGCLPVGDYIVSGIAQNALGASTPCSDPFTIGTDITPSADISFGALNNRNDVFYCPPSCGGASPPLDCECDCGYTSSQVQFEFVTTSPIVMSANGAGLTGVDGCYPAVPAPPNGGYSITNGPTAQNITVNAGIAYNRTKQNVVVLVNGAPTVTLGFAYCKGSGQQNDPKVATGSAVFFAPANATISVDYQNLDNAGWSNSTPSQSCAVGAGDYADSPNLPAGYNATGPIWAGCGFTRDNLCTYNGTICTNPIYNPGGWIHLQGAAGGCPSALASPNTNCIIASQSPTGTVIGASYITQTPGLTITCP